MSNNKDIQIIIPMTGLGSRFKNKYKKIKPFIKVNGIPMVEWVVKMFPGDFNNIKFICQKVHLDELNYIREDLNKIIPNAIIYNIENWEKRGPANDILKISKFIDNDFPVIVCYCDYYMHWNYKDFKQKVFKNNYDGAIPCYSGFHPHLIPEKNLYASCKVDEKENLIEIKEKYSWNKDKTKVRHSPGLYYFKSGFIMKKYLKKMIDANDNIMGEYYVSLPYNYLVKDGLKVWCPINVTHFCQWGTPEDLENYLYWINIVRKFKS